MVNKPLRPYFWGCTLGSWRLPASQKTSGSDDGFYSSKSWRLWKVSRRWWEEMEGLWGRYILYIYHIWYNFIIICTVYDLIWWRDMIWYDIFHDMISSDLNLIYQSFSHFVPSPFSASKSTCQDTKLWGRIPSFGLIPQGADVVDGIRWGWGAVYQPSTGPIRAPALAQAWMHWKRLINSCLATKMRGKNDLATQILMEKMEWFELVGFSVFSNPLVEGFTPWWHIPNS